ncbi:hypothetical protein ACFL4W_03545 [Planctomycetota bacterium]
MSRAPVWTGRSLNACWIIILIIIAAGPAAGEDREGISADTYKLYLLNTHIGEDIFLRFGFEYDHDYYLKNWLVLRGSGAVYRDSANYLSGFFHLGLRLEAAKFDDVYVRIGIGPTFIWRENWWLKKTGYQGNTFFGTEPTSGKYETAFLWYGGDIEVEWVIDEKSSFVCGIIPGYPVLVNINVGYRYHY